THTLLWYLQGNSNLSQTSRTIIYAQENSLFDSIASLWEIAIKLGLGKLELRRPFQDLQEDLRQFAIEILPITFADTANYLTLPLHHRDPFDRLLIAQALNRSLILISRDANFDAYSLQRLWS
ncbi:PIN domain nuclease, partial [filamentous cyanobacterium CCP1]